MLTSNIIRSIQDTWDAKEEKCGVVLAGNEIIKINNVSNDPVNSFVFNKRDWLSLLNTKPSIVCIWHTHHVDCTPSEADRVNQRKFGYPFLIVTKDDYLWLT